MPVSIRPRYRLPLIYVLSMSLIPLLLLSGPVYAEWVDVGGNNEKGMTVYVDSDTIRRKGDLVKMWVLADYKTIQKTVAGDSYLSSKSQSEFDCVEERARFLALTMFSGNMGNGGAVFTDATEQTWRPAAPESISRMLWKVACGKK